MSLVRCRIKPYIQPFERQLALTELQALARKLPQPADGPLERATTFTVESAVSSRILAKRLAYWEAVDTNRPELTRQVRLEATVNVVRNGIPFEELERSVPFAGEVPLPNRRCLRYGTHGIHEYRGKFFPQLVRALMNIAGARQGMVVADPMCGSGTTLVEAILSGYTALGLDLNPLSVLISHAKCSLLSVEPKDLLRVYQQTRDRLLHPRAAKSSKLRYFSSLPEADQEYLERWFSRQVLEDLDQVAQTIDALPVCSTKDLLRLSLSNILRRVSWQKADDLRVRKEIRLDEEIDPIKEFLEELGRSVRLVLAFLRQNHEEGKTGIFHVQPGDARTSAKVWKKWVGQVDTVITSPPYATALPYLDTDRLSLIYLKLLTRGEHRGRDQEMIGNREITNGTKDVYWQMFQDKRQDTPRSVTILIEEIARLNRTAPVGFRRQNLPSLLAKYFTDMRAVFADMVQLLRPGAPAYVVVGNNHTIAGGKHVTINTADLLVELAESVGLTPERTIPMEMLVSRDIFRKNAVASEYILCFRKLAQR